MASKNARYVAFLLASTLVLPAFVGCARKLPAPDFPSQVESLGTVDPGWTVWTLDGTPRKLSDFRGSTLFVNVWATWCGPCIREMPSISTLRGSLANDEDIHFVIVTDESAEQVRKVVEKNQWNLPVYTTSKFPLELEPDAYPTTYIIANGKVYLKHTGSANWDTDEARGFLRKVRNKTMFPAVDSLESQGVVDADWTLRRLDGEIVRAADLRGKTLFINRWGTYCPPCIGEMPSIQNLHESINRSDIEFVIFSSESPKQVQPFVKRKKWQLPFYTTNADEVPAVLQTAGIPATFIVNKDGEVVYKLLGPRDWSMPPVKKFLLAVADKK